jgi:hypothetical protein
VSYGKQRPAPPQHAGLASPAADDNVARDLDKRQDKSKNKQISESIILIAQAHVPVVAVARGPRVFAIQVVA